MTPVHSLRELLERYKNGERCFAEVELDQDGQHDLSGTCLAGADFSRAIIVANFQRADLRGTNFHRANVKTCDFSEADLRNADFRHAAICATTFIGALMDGATFEGAFFHARTLKADEKPDW